MNVKKLRDDAIVPNYAYEADAGVDLYCVEDIKLAPGQRVVAKTGLAIGLPKGYEAQVRPKSGLAAKFGITVLNTPGTIDEGYRGEVGVILINLSDKEFRAEKGSKIAQMLFKRVEQAKFVVVDDLDDTHRGQGGFGSSGLGNNPNVDKDNKNKRGGQ